MSEAKSYLEHLRATPKASLEHLRDSADKMIVSYGLIPHPQKQDPIRLSCLAIGFLSTAMSSFVASYFTTGLVSDEGEFEFEGEHLNRAVILPTLLGLGLLDENEPDSENCVWAMRICVQVLLHAGWDVKITAPTPGVTYFIRHLLGVEKTSELPLDHGSYKEVVAAVMSIPFNKVTIQVLQPKPVEETQESTDA